MRKQSVIHRLIGLYPPALLLLLVFFTGAEAAAQDRPKPGTDPYHDGRTRELKYPGYGQDEPDPANLTEVRIGYFGPSNPDDPLGGDIWLGTQLAIQEANRDGGYKGLPFRLLPAWSENPWSTGIALLARLAFSDRVWALIGSIDGPSTHLVEQVITKALVPLVNPGSTDSTVNYAFVPWMFSVPPSDARQADVLGPRVAEVASQGRFILISANDHDSEIAMTEFRSFLEKRGIRPWSAIQLRTGGADAGEAVARVVANQPGSVLVCAGAVDAALIVKVLRGSGYRGALFGTGVMGRRVFLERAGAAGNGVIFPLLYDSSASYQDFGVKFRSQFGREPDFTASQAYDTTRLLIQAIRKAGLNRARIRDALRGLSPWQGISGVVEWDALGQNSCPPRIGTIRDGKIVEVR